ncbi:MAG TPA: PQQ-binding-like beta-propeller repeat protein [Candidatus Hydrogenedentes bacterium]|nr:PQQ-binding-like beta-propeller repeat protein [Candidatus Hydrogenedentota bacterium]HPG67590.1 PQQ-binding-like beta-propeller repeat protein [Candidatus Hydrogenedentota bacterium]
MRNAAVCFVLLASSCVAAALDERWSCDTLGASRSLPVVADHMGDGQLHAFVTTRFDGTVWVAGHGGTSLHPYTYPYWLEGGIAAAVQPGAAAAVFAFQESAGNLNLCDYKAGETKQVAIGGEACIGTMPCFADLDGDRAFEIVLTRRNGIVTALDDTAAPLWQFDAGAPLDSSPAVATVRAADAAAAEQPSSMVYVVTTDGVLHAVSGAGLPQWRFRMDHAAPRFPSVADPLVVPLGGTGAAVLVSDVTGGLYAVDAVDGHQVWRSQAGSCALGTPAFVDVDAAPGRDLLTVDEAGHLALIDASDGRIRSKASLPEGRYVPRPLVADIHGDGAPDVLVATQDWSILVARLDGQVQETVKMQGNALEGLVLADTDADGRLELLAATECAKVYCFVTEAAVGHGDAANSMWTHPRAGFRLDGSVTTLDADRFKAPDRTRKQSPRPSALVAGGFAEDRVWNTLAVVYDKRPKGHDVLAVVRIGGTIVGSAWKPLDDRRLVVPFARPSDGPLTADLACYDAKGRLLSARAGIPVKRVPSELRALPSTEPFLGALRDRAAAYTTPVSWRLPKVCGSDIWHVARYMPEQWQSFGLAGEPFIAEAAPRIWAPANKDGGPFGPDHSAWPAFEKDAKPFFVMNDYFRPEEQYPDATVAAIRAMAGERFLGFPVHEWAYHVWKSDLEPATPPPATRQEATAILKKDFDLLLDRCHGQMYEGQGYCLFHHQAFEWGAPMGYCEVGENIPCAPLQFAFIRGAARQYGNRPWGAYLSNWFRGAVVDTRYCDGVTAARWSPPDCADGPECGHSPYLEFRLEVAAGLAGATFVHHESDGHHDSIFTRETAPGAYSLSRFGAAMRTWYNAVRQHPDRGIPYTPMAFLLDFDHGWRPREDIYGVWPQERPDTSIEAIFRHVYAWDGRLDFERGYLSNGPYGDIFDAVTNHAGLDVLRSYAMVWPIGAVSLDSAYRDVLTEYVRQGGILVLDSALALGFSTEFLGVRFRPDFAFATGIQSALGSGNTVESPYRYRLMKPARDIGVLAWTQSGEPLLTWQRYGEGLVVVAATDHWLDETEQLTPLAPMVLGAMASAFLPVQWTPGIEVLINRVATGWVIGVLNNSGIVKVPTHATVLDPEGARNCVLAFGDRVPLRFTPRLGDFRWSVGADGLYTHLNPGALAVVEVQFSGK